MNESQRNEVIANNENLDLLEYHKYSDDCDCPNCKDERSGCWECGVELKSDEIDFCQNCILKEGL